jgi:hypothetical protein
MWPTVTRSLIPGLPGAPNTPAGMKQATPHAALVAAKNARRRILIRVLI